MWKWQHVADEIANVVGSDLVLPHAPSVGAPGLASADPEGLPAALRSRPVLPSGDDSALQQLLGRESSRAGTTRMEPH